MNSEGVGGFGQVEPRRNKVKITTWIFFFPFSMVIFLFSSFCVEILNLTFKIFRGFFEIITKFHTKDLKFDDIKREGEE